ncbi:MAG: adenosine deaminase [Neofamilia sp.]
MKKYIDLHCHLDGSLDIETSFQLAISRGLISEDTNIEKFQKMMRVSSDNESLEEFLSKFELPISILQDEEALSLSTVGVIKKLSEDNIAYAEIRFAPQHHTRKGLSQEQVVLAVLEGIKRGAEIYEDVKVNLILCMMRNDPVDTNPKENIKTIEIAKDYLERGVCAVDLAGGEMNNLEEYKEYFEYAKSLEVPYIIHAGENPYPNNVDVAINFGAKRIGRGIHAIDDREVLEKLIESKIPIEVCITSNIQCKCAPSYEFHPIKELFDKGVKVTINTDNRTLSDTNLEKEIEKAKNYYGFTLDEIKKMQIDAIDSAFLTEKEKAELINKWL